MRQHAASMKGGQRTEEQKAKKKRYEILHSIAFVDVEKAEHSDREEKRERTSSLMGNAKFIYKNEASRKPGANFPLSPCRKHAG
jgi:hypothetical protein